MVYVATSAPSQKVKSPKIKIKGKTRNAIGNDRKEGKACGGEQAWQRDDEEGGAVVPEHEGKAWKANPTSPTT